MKTRTIYYSNEKTDDFASLGIKRKIVDEHFTFIHRGIFWKTISFILYYVIAIPLVFLINRVWFGVRIKKRKNLKKCKGGLFLYGNHTHYFTDATLPAMLAFPRKAYVIAGAEAISIKGLGWLVQMLGGLALPTERSGTSAFRSAVQERCSEGSFVAIFPEAHIWPYYIGIRDFSPASFLYPVSADAPAAAFVTTYRQRRLKFLPPAITVYVSEPFYPDPDPDVRTARKQLRDQIYDFMVSAAQNNEVEYIRYVKE